MTCAAGGRALIASWRERAAFRHLVGGAHAAASFLRCGRRAYYATLSVRTQVRARLWLLVQRLVYMGAEARA